MTTVHLSDTEADKSACVSTLDDMCNNVRTSEIGDYFVSLSFAERKYCTHCV